MQSIENLKNQLYFKEIFSMRDLDKYSKQIDTLDRVMELNEKILYGTACRLEEVWGILFITDQKMCFINHLLEISLFSYQPSLKVNYVGVLFDAIIQVPINEKEKMKFYNAERKRAKVLCKHANKVIEDGNFPINVKNTLSIEKELADLQRLKEAVNFIRQKIIQNSNNRIYYTEENVRSQLVTPFFQSLGYDTTDPQQFRYEYHINGKRVDCVILLNNQPVLLIEIKNIRENLWEHIDQVEYYFNHCRTASFAILTNMKQMIFFEEEKQTKLMNRDPLAIIDMLNPSKNALSFLMELRKEVFLNKIHFNGKRPNKKTTSNDFFSGCLGCGCLLFILIFFIFPFFDFINNLFNG